ncbi:hypothetical protein ABZX98_13420 [Streptomyces sp. NPDC002992]|uniref:hypothetical protein n=1 Tax=Streptomyces sp. NPDC002992 TaxID=3154273 RepID=UPI0033A6AFFC
MGRVARPCTTATFIEYVASVIARDASPNTISAHVSAIRTWMPDDKKPGTAVARGMLNEHRKDWGKRVGVRKAPAITDDMLRATVDTCDLRHPIGIRDRCALLLGADRVLQDTPGGHGRTHRHPRRAGRPSDVSGPGGE